jgi:hypothetical protein
MQILHKVCTKFGKIFHLNLGRDWLFTELWTSAYMMYSWHSSLAQLFGDDSDRFRSGLDDDGSDMEICGVVRGVLSWGFSGWKGLIFLI